MIKTWLGRRSWIAAMLLAIAITVGSLLGLESAHRRRTYPRFCGRGIS